jgi:YesN/AraC family two-component response regulator
VLEANNGREGWNRALETIPDLIISDMMMPVMDGIELCRKIKKDERTSHIPVVILTVLSSNNKQIEGIDAGAEDYITKPFDISLLGSKVGNILSVRKALREKYSKEIVLMPKEVVLSSPDEKFLRKVIQIIEKNIANTELDIDFLARHVGVSRTQLYRKIKALTDMAAKEFVKDMRLKRASQLITQDKFNISEIAYEVGFNDMSYFRKCFKECYGVSPTEYLKTSKEN